MTVDDERRDRGADRRQSRRILVDLEVDYQCEDTFLFAYITDMSAFGIFIRTNNPEPAGTHLRMRFKLPDLPEPLAVEGEVIWVNAFRPGDFNSINPGMGIRFVDLTEEEKDELMDLIKKIAYLEDHIDDDDPQAAAVDDASDRADTSDTATDDDGADDDGADDDSADDDGVDRSSVN